MTIYNLNLGIGWASSGVEYAQAYRAKMFRNIKQDAKFVFMEMLQSENIQNLTQNLGLLDEEVIWLYQYFTDIKIAPTTYTLEDLKASFDAVYLREERQGSVVRYFFEGDFFITAYLPNENSQLVNRAEFVSRGKLIRKDYFSYTKIYSEYYTPRENRAYLYQRRFFNEDGSLAYEEIIDDKDSVFRFKDRIFYTMAELIAYFLECLKLTNQDILILDRSTGIGQAVLQYKGPAKIGVVVHAEHYSDNLTDDETILWNNYYEYQFQQANLIDFFITATAVQKDILEKQFAHYDGIYPRVYEIPVGSLAQLTYPSTKRKPKSLISASRLADEKHLDWLVRAVVKVAQTIPDVTFDIYGEGGERNKLTTLIKELGAENYIRLMGHQDMTKIYADYEIYLAGSTSEGFGLTLLEAIGSGLPIIGFDVPYGNPTFVLDGQNGYLIERRKETAAEEISQAFAEKILQLLEADHLEKAHQISYKRAADFLTTKVEKKWQDLIEEVLCD